MEEKKESAPIICKNCGGKLTVDTSEESVECPYCGTVYSVSDLLGDSEAERIERIKSKTIREVENAKQETEKARIDEEKRVHQDKETAEREEKFKKSKRNKWLIVFAVISGLTTAANFSHGINMPGIIALMQTVLYLTAWLMGRQIIHEKRRNFHSLLLAIALLLNIPFFMFNARKNSSDYDAQKLVWTDISMHEELPEPEKAYGTVHEYHDSVSISLEKADKSDYKAYVEECKNAGYIIDTETSPLRYEAYNADGYKLSLVYYESLEKIDIDLKAPIEMAEISWPSNKATDLLPAPQSNIGKIQWEYDDSICADIGNTSPEDYRTYVSLAQKYGFTVDYEKGDTYYRADHIAGFHLNLEYEGFNTMFICIEPTDEPVVDTEETTAGTEASAEEATETVPETGTTAAEETEATAANDLVDGMHPEFREAMDSYEAFIDEYIEFMTKYAESDDQTSMLVDYGKFMLQYAEAAEKFDAWDEDDMNDTELDYYLQVQTRVSQKLLSVASE